MQLHKGHPGQGSLKHRSRGVSHHNRGLGTCHQVREYAKNKGAKGHSLGHDANELNQYQTEAIKLKAKLIQQEKLTPEM